MTEPTNPSGTTPEILIVEDSAVEAEILRRILVRAGYRVPPIAKNGEEGLQALREHPCALVISDINMPVMDGYQLCRAIKLDEELWGTPVILVTMLSEPKDIIMALDVGAESYITKPYVEANLLERISSLLANPLHRKLAEERRRIQVEYGGKSHSVVAGDQQMANLLLSVYENSLILNRELMHIQNQLNVLNESLDEKVRERTAELQDSEAFKSSMIDNSNDCIKVLSSDGLLKYMSPGGQRLLEIEDINKYLGKSWIEFWNGEDREAAREAVSKAAQGEISNFQGYSPSERGTPKWWDIVITPIREANGAINTLLAISRDITGRKQAEEELQLRALLLDGASDTIFVVDFNGNFVYLNESAWKTRGYTRDEMMAMNLHVLDTPKYEKLIESRMRDLMENGRCIFESEHRRKDGSVMPVEINARIVESGGRKLALSVIRDITERKQAEATLHESEERHRQIIQTSMDGFWITNTEGRILDVNDAYCQLTGYAREELLNMRIPDVEAKETPEQTAQHIREIMTKGHVRFETRHRRKDGQLLDIEVSVVHRPDPEDGYFFIFLRDITERKQASTKINEQVEELRRWQEATMGREMRTLELKHEVNELLGQAGQPPRYSSAAAEGSLRSSGEPTGVPLAGEQGNAE